MPEIFSKAMALPQTMGSELVQAFNETLIMLAISVGASVILGGALGLLLYVTDKEGMWSNKLAHNILGQIINFMRAFPFIILVIALTGLTKLILGTSIGPYAASFVLSVAGIFYFARLIEQNLKEVPRGIIEAAKAMGTPPAKLMGGVLLSEARSGIALSITILTISLLSASAAAGMLGGGGLGDLAIRYGYHRYLPEVTLFVVVALSIMVIVIQALGNLIAAKLDKR